MLNGRTAIVILFIGCFIAGAAPAQNPPQTLADNWSDFLHYTKIGRFDLAKGYGQAILQSQPNPAELFGFVQANQQGYDLAMKVAETAHDPELAQVTQQLLAVIDQGRFLQRTEPKIIVEEIRRLTSTPRGKMLATRRLRDAGEYAVPFLLDAMAQVIQDPATGPKLSDMIDALPQIGRPAIRPLVAALQTDNARLSAEILRALGTIGYPQSLPYLKYVAEKSPLADLRELAVANIRKIDPQAANLSAAALFFQWAERYYYHDESLVPTQGVAFANLWFWDAQASRLVRVEVSQAYFHELMAMRCCEWSLRAEGQFGPAIGLWLAAYFKAEAAGEAMPEYFGPNHAQALVYATTAGPEYLHQALARAVNDRNAAVALGAVEALATTAGERSLLYTLGPSQPLLQALMFPDRAVRYSAAIAIANAGPRQPFTESRIVVQNLAEALAKGGPGSGSPTSSVGFGNSPQPPAQVGTPGQTWSPQQAETYALRSVQAMLGLAAGRNPVIDLSGALPALIGATKDARPEIRVLAGQVLAYLGSPDAQRAIAATAMHTANDTNVRTAAFGALVNSAKLNGNMLPDTAVDDMYRLISSADAEPALRSAAAAAYGSLNLPSPKVKSLILDQARN